MTVTLKHFQSEDLETLWKVAFSDPKAEWHQWDGPYFNQEVPIKLAFNGLPIHLSTVFGQTAF